MKKRFLSVLLTLVMLLSLLPTTAFAATTINTINIKGITAPVAGEAPVITGITTDTTGITLATVQWQKSGGVILNSSDKFEAGQTYYLYVRYEVADGYKVSDGATVTSDLANSTYETIATRVTFQYTVPAAQKYTVTVTGGTVDDKASVTTEAGTRLQLRAPEVSGKRFIGWSGLDGVTFYGDNAKVTDPILGFIMPAKDLAVTANYQDAVEITTVNIKGITKPLAGANPVRTGITTDTTGLSVKDAIWYFKSNSTSVAHDYEFKLGDKIKLLIVLDVADGYTFADPVTITADLEYTAAYRGLLSYGTVYLEYTVTEEMPAAKTLDSIAITTPPTKTAYTAGESFDPAGMVVTATYSDRSTAPVDGYTVSPAGALSESDTEITVTYTEDGVIKTATQAITVTAVPAPQTATIVVKKTDNEDKALAGATFALTLPGSAAPTYTAVSDANGLATFTGVADGSYTLTENEAPDGYIRSEKSYEVYVRNGNVTIILAQAPNGQQYDNNAPVVFVNHPIPAPDIVVLKTDGGQNYIAGASFALTKEGETTPADTAVSGADGLVTFTGVADGTYILTETAAPAGYIKTDKTYKFLVENGEVSLYEDGDPTAYQRYLEIANEPIVTVTLPITKVVVKGGTSAPGPQTFTFKIKEFTFQGYDVSLATILENTITTNGVGSYEGVLKFTLPGNAANDILSEGIVIVEMNGGAANWTYDGTEWTAYANNAAAFGGQWIFLNGEPGFNGAERATFTNTYSYTPSNPNPNPNPTPSVPTLNKEDHNAFLQGFTDGTFRPDENMTRAQATVMFARLLVEKMDVGATYTNSFSDVPADYWAANEIGYMEKFGIIKGFDDGTFRPDAPITRAQFAAIACRFEELTEGTKTFSDVPADHWAATYISYAAERGWVEGYPDGTFRPDAYITRAQVAAVACRLLDRNADQNYIKANPDKLNTYPDMTETHFAYWYVLEASNGHDYTKSGGVETWTGLHE